MPTDYRKAKSYLDRLLAQRDEDELARCLMPSEKDMTPRLTGTSSMEPDVVARRWRLVPHDDADKNELLDAWTAQRADAFAGNVENFIGTAKLPVGLAGPLRVNGIFARGDYYVPLATTEAVLVASLTRGAQVVSQAGGCVAAVLNQGVTRAPGFAFAGLSEAGRFVNWLVAQIDALRAAAESTTRHGKLLDVRITLEGNYVYVVLEFETGDAAGQNMVTIATEAICRHIVEHTPVPPRHWFVEANLSGDKKACAQSFQSVRGYKVTAETVLPAELVEERLHCSVDRMLDYYRMSATGAALSGAIGVQGHFANALAAVYIACGQDAACVAESAVGTTRFEITDAGALYCVVTLPNVIVGTVGGGTGLPSQRAALRLLGMTGPGRAPAFAELCAGIVLAGEISIVGALAAGEFTRAHQGFARDRTGAANPNGR